MHAIRQYAFGGSDQLRYEMFPDPEPGSGQVRIAVSTAGVQLLDTVIRRGQAPSRAAPDLPMTPGREVAGVVDQVGPGVDADHLGRRVVADLGALSGGYAELALAPARGLHLLPDHVSDDAAVAMVGTGRTTMAILELAQPASGDVVLVTGAAGGVGTMLLQAAGAAGATVIGLASGARKAQLVAGLGAAAIDCTDPGWMRLVRQHAGDRGATVLLDGVGGPAGTALLDAVSVGGRVVMFGTASGSAISLTSGDIYARGISVAAAVGARLLQRPGGLRSLEERALAALADGRIRPVIGSTFALTDAASAHQSVESRSTTGKTVLKP